MPTTRGDETRRLRVLHESYAEQVNAAIGEDREDLVRALVDSYLAEAMSVMAASHGETCGRPGCPSCERPAASPPPPTWRQRLRAWFGTAGDTR